MSSTYASMMDRLDLKVQSPDTQIKARLNQRTNLNISFVRDAYLSYTDWALSQQLAALSKLLWVGRRRASLMARKEALGEIGADRFEEPRNPEEREYFDKRATIEATGTSANGWITATTVGWTHWNVELAPRTVRTLSEQQFCAEAVSVFAPLLADYQAQLAVLLDDLHRRTRPEYFDRPRPR